MRVPRTFTFVDLSGFTNYTAAFGDDAAGRILSAFRSLVREIASERGVRIAKWLGDGCMLVSVEPTQHQIVHQEVVQILGGPLLAGQQLLQLSWPVSGI